VAKIFGDYTVRVGEGVLSDPKGNSMLNLVLFTLLFIPFESNFWHNGRVSETGRKSNIKIHIMICKTFDQKRERTLFLKQLKKVRKRGDMLYCF